MQYDTPFWINSFLRCNGGGFSAHLRADWVEIFATTTLTTQQRNHVIRVMRQPIAKVFGKDYFEPIQFVGDSLLLRSLAVSGNCACLSLKGSDRSDVERGEYKHLTYHPHNVDTYHQGAAQLGAWLAWLDYACMFDELKRPVY